MVGLVTIPYGIVNAVVSFTSGGIVKYIGRLPVFIAGAEIDHIQERSHVCPLD